MTFSEVSDLPLLERIQKYRGMAYEARQAAETASSRAAKDLYKVIAEHWETLAQDTERKLGTDRTWWILE